MKKVFEYMGWKECKDIPDRFDKECSYHECCHNCINYHVLNGNDMVLAINKMNGKRDWDDFKQYYSRYYSDCITILPVEVWLFGSPDNFFKLMEEWLNEKAD